MSKNKSSITIEDIHAEYEESKELNTTRLFIKQNEHYIGLVDYSTKGRSDHNPWISLFVIHRQFQGGGTSAAAYQQVEHLIRQETQGKIRLAVHQENEKGIEFWSRLGFKKFKEVILDGKPHYCLENDW